MPRATPAFYIPTVTVHNTYVISHRVDVTISIDWLPGDGTGRFRPLLSLSLDVDQIERHHRGELFMFGVTPNVIDCVIV